MIDEPDLVERSQWADMAEELAGLGYWRLDALTNQVQWSPNMFRIFGFPVGDEPPLEEAMSRVHPDDRAHADAQLANAFAGLSAITITRIVQPDGQVRYVEGRCVGQFDSGGRALAVVGALQDITSRRLAEQRLQEAQRRTIQATAAKGEFLANVSHDLRTPLNAIMGFASILEDRTDLPLDAQHQVRRISSASEALLGLANDVLDFAKLEANRVRLIRGPVDVLRLCEETLDLFTLSATEKGIGLVCETHALPPYLDLDGPRLRQILVNLLSNALKHTHHGTVRLTAAWNDAASKLEMRIEDTGSGITEAMRSQLFQRFSQLADAPVGGAGLGLAICKALVELMNGEIGVLDNTSGGAVFAFDLPTIRAVASPKAAGRRISDISRCRVLVVDDSPTNREIARNILGSLGVIVTEAIDGAEAIQTLGRTGYDLVLLDVHMPFPDGRAVLAAVRAQPGPNQATPFLAFTADQRAGDAPERWGFDGALLKPLTVAAVAEALARWLGGRSQSMDAA